MLGFHPIRSLVPAAAMSSSLKSLRSPPAVGQGANPGYRSDRGRLAAVGQCAKSVILPADFMGTSGSEPLPPSGLKPSPSANPPSTSTSSVSAGAIAAVAVLVGLAYWFLKGS